MGGNFRLGGEDIWASCDQGAAPAYMLARWVLELWRPREHCLEAQIYYQKYMEKIQIPLELILYGLKWRSVFLCKNVSKSSKISQDL